MPSKVNIHKIIEDFNLTNNAFYPDSSVSIELKCVIAINPYNINQYA